MLTENNKQVSKGIALTSESVQTRIGKMLSFEWLGQTLASLCWIISVFTYGIESTGDWLQLLAASCWMVSNIATIVAIRPRAAIATISSMV
jgi:hypothetical protein